MSGTALDTKPVVFELDDLTDTHDPYRELLEAKKRLPGLKATLFAIPGQCSAELLERYKALGWVELGIHGYHHSTMECAVWGEDETLGKVVEVLETGHFARVFKAPGWMANKLVYQNLANINVAIAGHADHAADLEVDGARAYVYNALGEQPTTAIHGHTWETCGNGPSWWTTQLAALDESTAFLTVSEAAK